MYIQREISEVPHSRLVPLLEAIVCVLRSNYRPITALAPCFPPQGLSCQTDERTNNVICLAAERGRPVFLCALGRREWRWLAPDRRMMTVLPSQQLGAFRPGGGRFQSVVAQTPVHSHRTAIPRRSDRDSALATILRISSRLTLQADTAGERRQIRSI